MGDGGYRVTKHDGVRTMMVYRVIKNDGVRTILARSGKIVSSPPP